MQSLCVDQGAVVIAHQSHCRFMLHRLARQSNRSWSYVGGRLAEDGHPEQCMARAVAAAATGSNSTATTTISAFFRSPFVIEFRHHARGAPRCRRAMTMRSSTVRLLLLVAAVMWGAALPPSDDDAEQHGQVAPVGADGTSLPPSDDAKEQHGQAAAVGADASFLLPPSDDDEEEQHGQVAALGADGTFLLPPRDDAKEPHGQAAADGTFLLPPSDDDEGEQHGQAAADGTIVSCPPATTMKRSSTVRKPLTGLVMMMTRWGRSEDSEAVHLCNSRC